ncbi:uncharacterized protein LOC127650459 isoform X2 [Xyrauchen texanus]|nr:uncharacterized protein LOC127650459 isoform X2 [Xyrauchen texanus]
MYGGVGLAILMFFLTTVAAGVVNQRPSDYQLRYITLLLCLGTCLSPPPQINCNCVLPCDASPLGPHEDVYIKVTHQSKVIFSNTFSKSNLVEGGSCSVTLPDCSVRGKNVLLQIYPVNQPENVLQPLFSKTNINPICEEQERRALTNGGGAKRSLSITLLILMGLCLCLFFKYGVPR